MILADGFRLFYRLMAAELYGPIARDGPVELVIANFGAFPEEDVLALAEALALMHRQGIGVVSFERVDGDCLRSGAGTRLSVFDLRGRNQPPAIDPLLERAGIVFLRNQGEMSLPYPKVLFDRSQLVTFRAVTAAIRELIDAAHYGGQGVDMPVRYLAAGFRRVADDFNLFPAAEGESVTRIDRLIEIISAGWRYEDRAVDPALIRDWFEQFDEEVRPGALDLLRHINAVGYHSTREIATTLTMLLRSQPEQTQLVSIQAPGKSEQRLLYEMRTSDRTVPLLDALQRGVGHICCIDDVIGSGDTLIDNLFGPAGSEREQIVIDWLSNAIGEIGVLAAIASSKGIERIENDPRAHGRIKVSAKLIMSSDHGIFAPELRIFANEQISERFKSFCMTRGDLLWSDNPLGWGDCAWGIVTEYNVPDCSLPIIWCHDDELPWKALFPRR